MGKNLLEIRGSWKVVGEETRVPTSYKSSKGGSWIDGYAKLIRTGNGTTANWILSDARHKALKKLETGPMGTVILYEAQKRLGIKTSDGFKQFLITPSNHDEKDMRNLEKKTKTTLALLNSSTPVRRSEKLSADDALESLFSDEEDFNTREKPRKPNTDVRAGEVDMDAWIEEQDEWRARNTYITPPDKQQRNNITSSSSAIVRSDRTSFYNSKDSIFASGGSLFSTGIKTYSKHNTTPKLKLMPLPASYDKNKYSSSPAHTDTDNKPKALYSDDDDETLAKPRPLQGFSNLGNTCYMNVVLQSLLSLDLFTADLLHCYTKYRSKLETTSLLRCLSELAECKRATQSSSREEQTNLIKKIRTAVSAKTHRYNDFRQHDAHEFFCEVIDMVKEEIISLDKQSNSPDKPQSEGSTSTTPQQRVPRENSGNNSPVNASVDNFEFELGTRLECTGCQRVTSISETHNALTVSIPEVYLQVPSTTNPDGTASHKNTRIDTYIQDTIDSYFQSETVDFCCDSCGCGKALATQTFKKLPRVLVVVAKRFDTVRYNIKIEQRLCISRHITLSSHCQSHIPLAQGPTHKVDLWTIPHLKKATTPSTSSKDMVKTKAYSDTIKPSTGVKRLSSSPSSPISGRGSHTSPPRTKVKKRLLLPSSDNQSNRALSPVRAPPSSPELIYPPDSPTRDHMSPIAAVSAPHRAPHRRRPTAPVRPVPKITLSTAVDEIKSQSTGKFRFKPLSETHRVNSSLSAGDVSGSTADNKISAVRQALISDYTMTDNSDDDFKKAIELSKLEHRQAERKKSTAGFTATSMLSEEEQMELAIKQSLIESGIPTSPISSPLKQAADPGQLQHSKNVYSRAEEKLIKSYSQGLRGGCRENQGLSGDGDTEPSEGDPFPRLNDSLIISCDEDSLMSEIDKTSEQPKSPTDSAKRKPTDSASKRKSTDSVARRKSADSAAFLISSDEETETETPSLSRSLTHNHCNTKQTDDRVSNSLSSISDKKSFVQTKLTFPMSGRCSDKKRRRIIFTPTKDSVKTSSTVMVTPTPVKSDGNITLNNSHQNKHEGITCNAEATLRTKSPGDDEEGCDQTVPTSSNFTSATDNDEFIQGDEKDKENIRPPLKDTESQAKHTDGHRAKLVRSPSQHNKIKKHAKDGAEFGFSYNLFGVVSHLGSSSSHGHYVNDVLNIKDSIWLSYDDSYVKVTDISSVCSKRDRSGYIYFYIDSMICDDIKHQE